MTLEETECLQAENERLLDENERLTQIGARRDPRPLVNALAEYLDWNDDPNGEMSRDAQAAVARHLTWPSGLSRRSSQQPSPTPASRSSGPRTSGTRASRSAETGTLGQSM